eukprot:TRINITY_DN6391_c0_g1_i4.p1 TRINITY_DN6391_c0_g1~~TRINITY_DN6391_c0_g1_i4.p1  ORF type:complete len:218 (+),score=47.93 TRINITY_DN6391_c0_g1_i4:28-681(+)
MAEKKEEEIQAIIIGGSGQIGRCVVAELVANEKCTKITSLGRREVSDFPKSEKLKQVIVDMDKLNDYSDTFEGHNVAYCCLGTTRKDAGSDEAFRKVDYHYVCNFADLAKKSGVNYFSVVSSTGANKNSWFLYMKTKGEMEDYVSKLKFNHTSIWRPGLLDRGSNARFGEKFAGLFMKKMPCSTVARAMVARTFGVLKKTDGGVDIFDNKGIFDLGK